MFIFSVACFRQNSTSTQRSQKVNKTARKRNFVTFRFLCRELSGSSFTSEDKESEIQNFNWVCFCIFGRSPKNSSDKFGMMNQESADIFLVKCACIFAPLSVWHFLLFCFFKQFFGLPFLHLKMASLYRVTQQQVRVSAGTCQPRRG